jgi:hypothetical protein
MRNLVLLSCVLILLAGCSRTSEHNSPTANANRSAATSSSSAATSAEKIGVAECDEFIAKYQTCITDHIPEAQKTQYRENIDAWQKSWRQLANQTAKETLAMTCKRHILQAREGMKSFGCEF